MEMPGTMNYNSVKATGVVKGNHNRDSPGSRHLANNAHRLSPQHTPHPRLTQPGEKEVERLARSPGKSGHGQGQTSASTETPRVANSSQSAPLKPQQPSAPKTTTALTTTSSLLSVSVSTSTAAPATTTAPAATAPIPCPTTTGILSTTMLFPNNAALLEACGVPRPSSPSQLSPNSKLASVFSSYPSLKPSPNTAPSPCCLSSSSQQDDEPSEISSTNDLSFPSFSTSSDTSPNEVPDAPPTVKDILQACSSSSPALPLPSLLTLDNNASTTVNNNINNNNNNENNSDNSSNNSGNVSLACRLSTLEAVQQQLPSPGLESGGQGTVQEYSNRHRTEGDVKNDGSSSPTQLDTGSAREASSAGLQVPREKAVVVPSSPPTPHRSHIVAQQAPPLGPSRLAQIRQNNLAIKKQMKTKSMILPEVSETSEAEIIAPDAEETTPTNSTHTPVQPLPPQGSPYHQRRSGLQALTSDRPTPTAKVMPQISITDEDGTDIVPVAPPGGGGGGGGGDQSTPLALPQAFLRKLGLAVEDDDKDTTVDQLSEKEVESKFVTLSLAFKTDKLTLDQRVIVQERARDLAEQNVDTELQGIRDAIETLGDLASDPQVRDVVEKIRLHIDVLEVSAAKVSSRAEVFGAVQQERRLCKAMEVMVQYTENLRRIRAKEESEVQEARKVLSERSGVGYTLDVESGGPSRRSMSVCGFSPGIRTMRRRSEVALPRILGGTGSPSPGQESDGFHPARLFASNSLTNLQQEEDDEEGPKARFQSAVASTSMQHAVTATIRRASGDRQRSSSVVLGAPLVPNGAGGVGVGGAGGSMAADVVGALNRLRKTSPQPSLSVTVEDESCAASETSTSETTTPARKLSQDEQAYRKGFEQGLKAKLNEQLTELRDQQNNISRSLETVMDRVDQGEAEEAEFLASPTRLEALLTLTAKVRAYVLAYNWRSNKTAIRNLAGVAFLLLAMLMMFLSPPVPAHTRASSIAPPPDHPSTPSKH